MHPQTMRGPDKESQRIPPPPHGLSSLMDDTYIWGANPQWIQTCLLSLEKAFSKRGLRINPGKTFVMCSKEDGGGFIIEGKQVPSHGPSAVMHVLGSPVTFSNAPAAIVAEMQHRARKAFNANRRILCCGDAKFEHPVLLHPGDGEKMQTPRTVA